MYIAQELKIYLQKQCISNKFLGDSAAGTTHCFTSSMKNHVFIGKTNTLKT